MRIWVVLAASALGLAGASRVAAQRALGKLLFFEPALSVNGKRSCASCHRPEKAFTDHRGTPRALRFAGNLRRNSPTILNAAGQTSFFHDGRASSLDAVIEAVLTSPDEFGSSYAQAAQRLGSSAEYRQLFRRAFAAPVAANTINAALVAYLRAQTATASPYDRARAGGPALPATPAAGAALFAGAGGCAGCHGGPQFRDGQRHEVAAGQWVKTPTLRNVAVTMPYRADGGAATLAAVLTDGYHRPLPPRPLTAPEVEQLTAFLEALTDTTSADHRAPAALPRMRDLPGRAVGGQY
ncbi:cytochrome-c peroxidase [Hymenobacter sp.]|uniref:cytochrome-c peroxidase n=1 Tax=Hymenobacter sp. TaxID=1898978 RepID=UPI00286CE4ED|nr:cytochrome-c peroxidase [Hymenobacter sp.]